MGSNLYMDFLQARISWFSSRDRWTMPEFFWWTGQQKFTDFSFSYSLPLHDFPLISFTPAPLTFCLGAQSTAQGLRRCDNLTLYHLTTSRHGSTYTGSQHPPRGFLQHWFTGALWNNFFPLNHRKWTYFILPQLSFHTDSLPPGCAWVESLYSCYKYWLVSVFL